MAAIAPQAGPGAGAAAPPATGIRSGRRAEEQAPRVPSDQLLDDAIERLSRTEHGRELALLLRERRDDVVVLDGSGGVLPEGAGGAWVPARQKLYIRRDQLEHPAGITLLAHEAVHMRDAGSRAAAFGQSLLGVGRSLVDMAVAPVLGRNPVTAAVDGVRASFQVPMEVDAYHLQANLAQELGLRSDVLQHADGSPRSREELRSWLLENPLYQLPPAARAAVGAGFAVLGGRASGHLVNAAAARLAPTSAVGRHPGLVSAGALAVWGALLLHDQLTARGVGR